MVVQSSIFRFLDFCTSLREADIAIIVKLGNVAAMITVVIGKIIHGVVVLERSYYSKSGW